jgi:beta-N-acetylhexosaminidase
MASMGPIPVRGKRLIVLLTGIVVAVAAIVLFAANAAARRGSSADPRTTTMTTSASRSGGHSRHGSSHSHGAAGSSDVGSRPDAVSPDAADLAAAQATLPKLTSAQLAGQRIIYSYSGHTPPNTLLTLIKQGKAAGVIFFGGNITSQSQIRAVANELQEAAASPSNPVHLPLLLMTDQEGGVVTRIPGPPNLLSAKQIGQSAHPWATATQQGREAGKLLHSVGVNVNLAPVLDVFRQPGNFIDQFGRSFSNNAGKVAKLGTLYMTAEQGQGIAGTVKHFPGLGAATQPENTDLRPVTLRLSLSQIRTIDEVPYKAAIPAHVKLVMVSWAIYPALDAKNPAGLSSTIVQSELRKRLKFGGVTITDALEAGALNPFGPISHRATLAARAGMDLLLCSGQSVSEGTSALNSIEFDYNHHSLNATAFKAAVARIIALRAALAG